MKTTLALLLPTVLLLTGCNILGVDCTLEALPALRVSMLDAATGEPITSAGGMVIATDGAFADTVHVSAGDRPPGMVGLAEEREGSYTVEVVMDGYEPWLEEGVRVGADECHVRTVDVTARLEPLP